MQQIEFSSKITQIMQNKKGIYQNDPNAIPVERTNSGFTEYVEYLLSKGLKVNNLRLAQFKTKNNLPYLGLQAIDKINNNEILVSVPKELMLTTKIAYFSEIQEIFDAYPQFYCQHCSNEWQDRILLTYILYQWQLGRKSQWYHLIQNLPRDIDFLSFWNEEDLLKLNDPFLVKTSLREYEEFILLKDCLTHILDQYPQYFKKETYSEENIKWIFIHLVSRCFGSTLEQVAFVPFCEMFNHENTDVRYEGEYFENNIHKKPGRDCNTNESDESDGDSIEYDEEDFDYPEEVLEQIKQFKKQTPTYKLIDEQLTAYQNDVDFTDSEQVQQLRLYQEKCNNRIELQIQYLQNKRWYQENLNLRDNFTIIFVSKSLEYILEQIKMYEEDIISFEQVTESLKNVSEYSEQYLEYIKQYSSTILKRKNYQLSQFEVPAIQKSQTLADILITPIPPKVVKFENKETWKEDLFDNFVIKCSGKDEFEKGSQAYFSYGTNSNRALLLRYGFALEYNIYDYVIVKLQYIETIPFANDIAQYFQLSKSMKFKIKYKEINEDLLMYFRLQQWNFDEGIEHIFDRNYTHEIEQAITFLKEFHQQNFQHPLEEETKKLCDQSLGYHEYFAQVYKIERQRIIESQIEALKLLGGKKEQKFEWTNYLVDKFCRKMSQKLK